MTDASSIFMERFPLLALQMYAVEPTPYWGEIPKLDPGKAEVFYFYGLNSSVYTQCKSWLQKEKKLVFLEDDLSQIAQFLIDPLAMEMLTNPNIHIALPEPSILAEHFPVRRIEVAGRKGQKGLQKLRMELFRQTTLASALHTDRLHGYQPFSNFVRNVSHLPHSFYVNKLKWSFLATPAIICGAGPSLEKTLSTLHTLENKALIIAGGSTLAALSSHGIMPHFGMAIDPNLEEFQRFKNSFAFEVPLIYSTRVHPNVFHTCNGPFGYMRSGIGGMMELWMEEELGLSEPLLGENLSSNTISVTGMCVAFAQFLGCNPILLNGIDMAYTKGRRYASGVSEEKLLSLDAIDQEKSAADRIIRKKGEASAVRWIMESAGISDFAKKHKKTRFINTTDGGIGFRGIPYLPIVEAVKDFKEQNVREKVWDQIRSCSMPQHTSEKVAEKIDELRTSLSRLIQHLEVLAGVTKGVQVLAEMELQEEIATLYLFYDIRQILPPGPDFWKNWLELARQYFTVLNHLDG